MRGTTKRGARMLRRTGTFLGTVQVSPRYGDITRPAAEILAVADRLTELGLQQDLHHRNFRGKARQAQDLFQQLTREGIQPIGRLAKSLLPRDANLNEPVLMGDVDDYDAAITFALNLAERAEPHKAKFVEAGLKENFIDLLRANVKDLQQALEEKDEHLRRRAGATAAIEEEYARGKNIVRVLDAMLTPAWKDNPDLLAQWKSVSRFPRSAKEDPAEEETPSVPVSEVPAITPETPVATGGNTSADHHVA